MSLPGNALPNTAPPARMLAPDSFPRPSLLVDFERGGIAIQDPSQGLDVRDWQADYVGGAVRVYPLGNPVLAQTLFSAAGITELSISFDQNMRPLVAYMVGADAFLWWFDPVPNAVVTTALAAGVRSPALTLDDKRAFATFANLNDVLLFYIRAGGLYYRQQRERFQTERLVGPTDIPDAVFIRRAGMNTQLRVQVELAGQDIADATTWTFSENPALHAYHYARLRNGWDVPAAEIMDEEQVAQEADACDIETDFTLRLPNLTTQTVTLPRYRSGIVIPTDADPRQMMDEIMESMAGRDGWEGGRWYFRAGRMPAPVGVLDQSWLARPIGPNGLDDGRATVRFSNGVQRQERVNRITGSCVVPSERYQLLEFPAVEDAVLIGRFGEVSQDVSYQAVNHIAHAQHLASVTIRRVQASLRAELSCNISAYRVELFDVLQVNLPAYGIADKTMEVVRREWSPESGITLVLSEISAAIFEPVDELTGVDPAPNTNLPDIRQVDQLEGLDGDSESEALADGAIVSRLLLTWTRSVQQAVLAGGRVEVQYADLGQELGEDPELQWQIWEEDGAAASTVIVGPLAGHFYAVRARFVTSPPLRVRGPWSVQQVFYIEPLPESGTLKLTATASQFHFGQDGALTPPGQVVRFNALLSNFSATASFLVERYDFDDLLIDNTVVLGGSGNANRSLTAAQFGDAAYADITASTSSPALQDQVRVFRTTDGSNARSLSLQVSATQFIFNTIGAPQPATQTITVDAFTINYTAEVTFAIELYDASGTLIAETPALGGTGNTGRTFPVAQFFDAAYADIIASTTAPTFSARTRIVRGFTTAAPAGVVPFYLAVIPPTALGGDDARADVRLNPDGTIDRRLNNGSWEYRANWFTPTTAGIGDQFRVIASATGDALATGTLGSYEVLDVARTWALETNPLASFEVKAALVNFTIVALSDTVPIAMGTVQLDVAKEP